MPSLSKQSVAHTPRFITVEGIDGCGKSTQARLVAAALEHAGYAVERLREPGGAHISEKIRALLLDPQNGEMGDACELLLYEAARAQLVHEKIAPALAEEKIVVCDRFFDSTTAYQAYADGLDRAVVEQANALAVGSCKPDITFVYDIDVDAALARRAERDGQDRMEAKGTAFQQRVAEGFRAIAADDPVRVRLIDATEDIAHVFVKTVAALRAAGLVLSERDARAAYTGLFPEERPC